MIPCVRESRKKSEPASPDDPPHQINAPASPTPYDPYPGKFTMVPRAIAEDYGRKLGPTRTRIFEAMHHLIHGYKDDKESREAKRHRRGHKDDEESSKAKRHRRGQISYGEIADLSGVCVRTIERQMPKLIEDGFVKRLCRGHLNRGASVYKLSFEAPMPGCVVGPSGGQVKTFPQREDYRQAVGSEAQPTTDKIRVCTSLPTTPHLVVGRSACRVGVGPSLNRSWAQRSRPVVQAGRRAFPGDESVVD